MAGQPALGPTHSKNRVLISGSCGTSSEVNLCQRVKNMQPVNCFFDVFLTQTLYFKWVYLIEDIEYL